MARFAAAMAMVVVISLYGVTIDSRELSIARRITLQRFRADQLEARVAKLRLETQRLQSPERLRAAIRAGSSGRLR